MSAGQTLQQSVDIPVDQTTDQARPEVLRDRSADILMGDSGGEAGQQAWRRAGISLTQVI